MQLILSWLFFLVGDSTSFCEKAWTQPIVQIIYSVTHWMYLTCFFGLKHGLVFHLLWMIQALDLLWDKD